MPAIRHVSISRFRGFENFEVVLRANAVLVGEPGAGRSDLIEAIARVLDPETLRARRASDLDFFGLDTSQDVHIEMAIGGLSPGATVALTRYLEIWDSQADVLLRSLPPGTVRDPDRHEFAVRLGYRLWLEADQIREVIYWPKFADRSLGAYPLARQVDREQIPFLLQRGLGTRPLDLAPRGEFRGVIARQPAAAGYSGAVETFLSAVEAAAAGFTADPAVNSALEEVLQEVRESRRLGDATPAASLISFLPEGGSEAGLLRSLAAAATLDGAPPNLPTARHGASVLASLRGGLLTAVARRAAGAIVAVEDLGGEIDPHLARHLASRLRSTSGQLIISTRMTSIVEAFAAEEVLRLHGVGTNRIASAGDKPLTKPQRLASRYWARYLVPALHASAVMIVEGHTDRLGIRALADRALEMGILGSFDAAGIAIIEAGTNNQAPKLAEVARELGLYTIVVLDNEAGTLLGRDAIAQEAIRHSDVLVRLPSHMSIEQALIDGVPDAELVRVFKELDAAVGGLGLLPGWDRRTGRDLASYLGNVMHNRTGAIHEIYVEALDAEHLPPVALRALEACLRLGRARSPSPPVEL